MLSIFCGFWKIPVWDRSDNCIIPVFKAEGNTLCMIRMKLLSFHKCLSKPNSCRVCRNPNCHSELEMCQIVGHLSKQLGGFLYCEKSLWFETRGLSKTLFVYVWIRNLELWSCSPFGLEESSGQSAWETAALVVSAPCPDVVGRELKCACIQAVLISYNSNADLFSSSLT